jgi:hypothetical protein
MGPQKASSNLSQENAEACPARVYEWELQGFKAVVLENGFLRATVLPQLGGKLTSLVNIQTQREFLLQPPGKVYAQPTYGGAFDQYDTSGFDECFPTVSACSYPDAPLADELLPDHGELWSIPWQHRVVGDTIRIASGGRRLPYIFRKKLSLHGATLRLDYELLSLSDLPIAYLYSAHPLLKVEQGATLVLPPEVNALLIESSKDEELGAPGEYCSWPLADMRGERVRLDVLQGPELKTAHKLFTSRIRSGSCGVHFPCTREGLRYRFDPEAQPYIGLWLCQGGWPSSENGHFTVALEPCTGRTDSLAEAFSNGEHRTLQPHGVHRWWLEMEMLSDCDSLTV